jgi:CubicO group peptidase (beta-lactamase class C family)
MLKESAVLVLLVGFMISLGGFGPGVGEDSTPGPSTERFARVRAMILEAVQKSGVPSISIAAADGGKVIWEESFGYADKGRPGDARFALCPGLHIQVVHRAGLMVTAERKLLDLDKAGQ